MNKKIIRNINQLAYPILLNYLLLNVFEILDKAIIGHYSLEGFALVGVVAPPIYEITGALGVLSVAFNILAAEQKGKQNQEGFEKLFVVSKKMALLIGAAFIALGGMGGRCFFAVVYGQKGAQLEAMLRYFYPNMCTVLLNMLTFLYSAYYRNKLCTKISFYSTAVSTVVNLFFDICLVNGYLGLPELGIAGAAWGSVIGLSAGLLVYQVPYFRLKRRVHAQIKESVAAAKKIFCLYPTLFGQEFLEGTLFALLLSTAVSHLGIEQMAVYNLLDSVVSIISVSIYAYASSIQTYALQQKAAGNTGLAARYLKAGSTFTVGAMLFLCAAAFVFRVPIMHWIVADFGAISAASGMMIVAFLPIFPKAFCQVYMEYLQGTGKDRFVFLCTAAAAVLAGISILAASKWLGLYGIYLVMAAQYLGLSVLYYQKSIS